jgi:CheY-like chemotaxis protein
MEKVLIAEDDANYLMLIKSYLKRFKNQFEVITASDGLEAIETMKKEPISLLVTDLKMPKVEGLVLLSYVNRNFPKVPAIVMTSMRAPHIKEQAKKDALYFLEKPFKNEELARAIISALDPVNLGKSMEGISVISFLQLIKMDMKTCMCEVIGQDDQSGYFYFKNGVLYDAEYGGLTGEAAAVGMMQLQRATINFKKLPDESMERKIESELLNLILKTIQRKDDAIAGNGG